MKINLGAGNLIQKGYINHDIRRHRKEIDILGDLNEKRWIFTEDGNPAFQYGKDMFDEIRAWDVLEHLDDVINFMDNCWQLLKKDGVLDLKVCGYDNISYWIDITHKRAFHPMSFDYFDPDTKLGKEYGYYTDNKWKIISGPGTDRHNNVLIKLTPRK